MKGQISITFLISIGALIASVVTPVIYIGNIKESTAINTVEITILKQDQKEIKENVEYIRRTIEEMRAEQKHTVKKL